MKNIYNVFEQHDGHIPYEQFYVQMKKLNEEQRSLLLMIYLLKKKRPIKTFTFFLTRGVGTRKTFTIMCIIQSMLQHYIKEMMDVHPLKPKVMK